MPGSSLCQILSSLGNIFEVHKGRGRNWDLAGSPMYVEGRLLQWGKPGSMIMKDPFALCRRVLSVQLMSVWVIGLWWPWSLHGDFRGHSSVPCLWKALIFWAGGPCANLRKRGWVLLLGESVLLMNKTNTWWSHYMAFSQHDTTVEGCVIV